MTTTNSAPNSTPTHPCPLADADLWVLAGQSNMEGCGILKTPSLTDPRLLMFNMDNRWMPAQDPLHRLFEATAPVHRATHLGFGWTPEMWDQAVAANRVTPQGGVGPGLSFARHLLEQAGRPIGLVPSAHGGTSMAQWDPALKDRGDESHYGALLNRIAKVGGRIKGVLWYQGESDAFYVEPAVSVYEAAMLNLIDSLRRDTGIADLPFLCVQIGRVLTFDENIPPFWDKVREIQRQIVKKRPNVFMIGAADLSLDDGIHVSADDQQRLGRRLAQVALTHVYKLPGHGRPIDLESVEVLNTHKPLPCLRLRFSGVSGRLRALGRPSDFELLPFKPSLTASMLCRTDFDPEDPAALLLRLTAPLTEPTQLWYGRGVNPYLNITDEQDMAIPAFGPIEVAAD